MKTSILFSVLLLAFSINAANAQKEIPAAYLKLLPNDLKLDNSIVRSYRMTTDYYDFDLNSNFLAKRRITGIITYETDSAQWKDVYYAESKVQDETFSQGEKQHFLQDFKYRPNENVLTSEFFSDYLPEANPFVMNLIWDALGFDALAYCCWDSLKLNEEFLSKNINSELKIAIGTFENRDIRITWLGITKINGKICAVLKYSAMNNPLKLEYGNMSMSGRSHYWGEIYVSLSDKQIEYANLMEDVITDVNIKGREKNILGYTTRYINLSKIK
ncbi:MAG: hypothetical protein LBJ23_00970 [Tannerella sp.]|jgi:hypothetical protein|nr:hypothetical protein [Tannerella sp.]